MRSLLKEIVHSTRFLQSLRWDQRIFCLWGES